MISDRSDHIKILQENISKALTGSSPLLAIDNRLMILEQELLDNPENKTQIAEEILDLREKRTQQFLQPILRIEIDAGDDAFEFSLLV